MAETPPEKDGHILEHQNNLDTEQDEQTGSQPSISRDLPEGGSKGWLAVLACWCIMFNTFGYINAYGYVRIEGREVISMLILF